jgi:TonB family protein
MKPGHAFGAILLALAGMAGCAHPPAQKSTDPGATELFVVPGIGKHKHLPVGDCPAPIWPREARRYEIEGTATIKYRLLPDGRVSEPRVVKSSGWAILDDATIRLAMSCKYTPQQAAEAAGQELPLQFVWMLEGQRDYAGLVPGTCAAAGRFDGFQPFDRQASDRQGIKVRFLIDGAGAPQGVRVEDPNIDPVAAAEVVGYLASCRFAFDPGLKGVRTHTMYGRVMLR